MKTHSVILPIHNLTSRMVPYWLILRIRFRITLSYCYDARCIRIERWDFFFFKSFEEKFKIDYYKRNLTRTKYVKYGFYFDLWIVYIFIVWACIGRELY